MELNIIVAEFKTKLENYRTVKQMSVKFTARIQYKIYVIRTS